MFSIFAARLFAQKEVFDLVKYSAPPGWKAETNGAFVLLTRTDNKDKSWCQVAIYKSIDTRGSLENDFKADWEDLVSKNYNIKDTALPTGISEAEGWQIKTGTGTFTYSDKPAAAMQVTFTGYGKSVSIVAALSSDKYLQDIQNLVESIELTKPAEDLTNNTNNSIDNKPSGAQSGFSFNTTNFDDGWVSIIQDDWVMVSKEDMNVYLWYALPYNASDFSGTGRVERDYYWDNYVSKYFHIQTKQYQDNGEVIGSFKPPYVEGWATDKKTGQKRFIAMRISIAPNTAYITLASAKDEASLRQQFPNANGTYTSDLSAMDRYNRFAVSEKDILGTWQDGNTSTAQWYYVTPSGYEGYAGMTVAARSASFIFNSGGHYTSIHNGATGVVGAMSTFQQNYKGNYTVTNWNITATNRWQGKTENFNSWFMVIRGGRILCMDSGGMQYRLVKAK